MNTDLILIFQSFTNLVYGIIIIYLLIKVDEVKKDKGEQ